MKTILFFTLIAITGNVFSQGTSEVPSWVMWPGEGGTVRGSADDGTFLSGSLIDTPDVFFLPKQRLGGILSSRWIPEKPDDGKLFTSLRYEVTQDITVGLDYRPLTDKISLAANWRAISEQGDWQPAIILGTSNDDFGDISSQSY